MVLLTPTVHERLARCGTSIALSGLVSGAAVEVEVGGALHTFAATGGVHHLSVPPSPPVISSGPGKTTAAASRPGRPRS